MRGQTNRKRGITQKEREIEREQEKVQRETDKSHSVHCSQNETLQKGGGGGHKGVRRIKM